MKKKPNPYDLSTWGPACARGMPYKDTGAPVLPGTKAQVHKISSGRKARGLASDGVERLEKEARTES